MSAGKARIQSVAPDFTATAVVNGDFKDITLSELKGVLRIPPYIFRVMLLYLSTGILCTLILWWCNIPRKKGGLGNMKIPLIADKNCKISEDYGVLVEGGGIAFRGLFIIDTNGVLRQITINDIPVGRSVDETLRLVKAFQFTDKHGE
uniref:thioredoxin-dependent peroxiredoxin n=1 Tax=Ciona savignyi TaxID=51511 RepID=H2YIX9_CIOSA